MMIEPNEQFAYNNQTNPTHHPINYTKTQTNPTPHPMNYTNTRPNPIIHPMILINPTNQTDAHINTMIPQSTMYTQTDAVPKSTMYTQSNPIDLSTKHTNTHTPNENYTRTDMIP